MKIGSKKIFCADCRRLVAIHQGTANGTSVISCPRCGKVLRMWTGLVWR